MDTNNNPSQLLNTIVLVTGPTKSGKSIWAQSLVPKDAEVTYIATGFSTENDQDWSNKVEIHKKNRPQTWKTLESSFSLIEDIKKISKGQCIIIESLGGFVSSRINDNNTNWLKQKNNFISSLVNHSGLIIIVIEETGWGVVPHTKIGSLFRDRLGGLALELSSIATNTWLVVMGRAINLSEIGIQIS